MQGNLLFEYAVIRVVPKVEREEFLNVGVILYCRDKKFLEAKVTISEERLQVFHDIDLELVKEHLKAFTSICTGAAGDSPISKMDIASRFRWLTGTRSTIIQTSKVHPGLCADPHQTLLSLHSQLVL